MLGKKARPALEKKQQKTFGPAVAKSPSASTPGSRVFWFFSKKNLLLNLLCTTLQQIAAKRSTLRHATATPSPTAAPPNDLLRGRSVAHVVQKPEQTGMSGRIPRHVNVDCCVRARPQLARHRAVERVVSRHAALRDFLRPTHGETRLPCCDQLHAGGRRRRCANRVCPADPLALDKRQRAGLPVCLQANHSRRLRRRAGRRRPQHPGSNANRQQRYPRSGHRQAGTSNRRQARPLFRVVARKRLLAIGAGQIRARLLHGVRLGSNTCVGCALLCSDTGLRFRHRRNGRGRHAAEEFRRRRLAKRSTRPNPVSALGHTAIGAEIGCKAELPAAGLASFCRKLGYAHGTDRCIPDMVISRDVRQGSKACFFEKKQQKTFVSAVADPSAKSSRKTKVFWFLFSKNNRLPCPHRARSPARSQNDHSPLPQRLLQVPISKSRAAPRAPPLPA